MKRTVLLAVFAALGLAAALGFTARPASAYDIGNLPAAFHVSHITGNGACSPYYQIIYVAGDGTGAVSPDLCENSPTFQQDLDAFVGSPCTAAGATCTPPPPVTTTAPATTAAVSTDAAPPAPAPTTVTVTTVLTDPTIDQRLTALEANYAALAKRVDAIANANTASWDAFSASLAAGGTVADAAIAARSAGWNAIYKL